MTTQIENERKFFMTPEFRHVVKRWDKGLELFIHQGYLTILDDIEIRVRKSWNKAWAKGEITIKRGHGQIRSEETIEIMWDVAEALLEGGACGKWVLDKTRHRIFDRWEVDVYYRRHNNLVIMEIEKLPDEDETVFNNLELPVEVQPYLIREVTHDDRFKNRSLAVMVKTPK